MFRLLPRLLVLALALAPTAVLAAPSGAASTARTSSWADEAVTRTLTGHVERLAAVHRRGGESTRWLLDTGARTWQLHPGRTRLVAGARMEVTGTVSGDTLGVTAARVLRAPAVSARQASRATSTRVLVMRVYWNASAPAKPTTATTKDRVLTRAQTWFKNVSGSRYSISGAVTPWLKITKPSSCTGPVDRVMDQALARAKAKGYNPSGFGRYLVYMPCSDGFVTGLGSLPGKRVWLFGTIDLGTNVHEQGHNLGLDHAKLRTCTAGGTRTTWSGSCSVQEYGDWSDAMGNGPPAHFNIAYKRKLGWAGATSVVTADATRTLTPTEVTTAGLKGLGVKTSTRTYWVELRSGANEDSGIHPDCRGVQIRFGAGGATQALDLLPGNPDKWAPIGGGFLEQVYDDDSCTSLPVGSSWTTPEGVRIIARSGGLTSTQVQVDYGFGAAKAPQAPAVSADTSVPDKVTLTWTKPSDQGSILTRYEVRQTDGTIVKVPSLAGDVRTKTLTVPAGDYTSGRLQVRAVNRVGAGVWGDAPAMTVSTLKPSGAITSPAAGASVSGEVPIGFSATANATSGSPISRVELEVDGDLWASKSVSGTNPTGTLTWFSESFTNGPHVLRVRVQDTQGKEGWSAPRTLQLNNPVVVFDTPTAGQTVSGKRTVTFHADNVGTWSFTSGSVRFNGTLYSATKNGSQWSAVVDTRTESNDTYWLVASLTDAAKGTVEKEIQVVSHNTEPTITTSGVPTGTITDPTQTISFSTSDNTWPWDQFRAEVTGGQQVGYADAAGPMELDLSSLPNGTYTLKVVGTYGEYHEVFSAGKQITVSWPARSIAWGSGAPATGATVSGDQPVPFAITPTAWPWEYICVEVNVDGSWWDYDCVTDPAAALSWSTSWTGNGTHSVRLHAYDSQYRHVRSTARTWTVAN